MSESVTETYEVTDGKVTIQADAIRPGAIYRPVEVGDGTVYLAENRRRDDDGARMILLSASVFRQLQVFCNDMTKLAGHRLEYTVTMNGLVAWALKEERWEESAKRVLEYGVALYSGEKKERVGDATFKRFPPDIVNMIQQFASHLSETTGGLTPERAIVLNALLEWALTQDEAMDVVDDYNLKLIQERQEARRRALAKEKDSDKDDSANEANLSESNGVSVTPETEDEGSDDSTATRGSGRRAKSAS